MITNTPLTREDIKRLRNADNAVFRWQNEPKDPLHTWSQPRTAYIELIKEVKSDGFRDELRERVTTEVAVTNYGHEQSRSEWSLKPAISGSWVLLTIRYHMEWHTFVNALRVGDALTQVWVIDNRNELLKEAHLTMHELKVEIVRPRKGQDTNKRLLFMLDAGVRTPYGAANEIKREGVLS